MLTPADIQNQQFSTTRLKEGYDQKEVDDFFDRVQEDFSFAVQQLARLEEENRTLRRNLEYAKNDAPTAVIPPMPTEAPKPSAVAERLLEAAEIAAQGHEAEAKAKADEIVRQAGGDAARIVEEAQAAAERIKDEGLALKYRRNEELDKQHTELSQKVASLQASGEQIKGALAKALESVGQL